MQLVGGHERAVSVEEDRGAKVSSHRWPPTSYGQGDAEPIPVSTGPIGTENHKNEMRGRSLAEPGRITGPGSKLLRARPRTQAFPRAGRSGRVVLSPARRIARSPSLGRGSGSLTRLPAFAPLRQRRGGDVSAHHEANRVQSEGGDECSPGRKLELKRGPRSPESPRSPCLRPHPVSTGGRRPRPT